MKKVMGTTLFWILVILGFAVFLKFFDDGTTKAFINEYIMGEEKCPECSIDTVPEQVGQTTETQKSLDMLNDKVDTLLKTVTTVSQDVESKENGDEKPFVPKGDDMPSNATVEVPASTENTAVGEENTTVKSNEIENNPEKIISQEDQYKAFLERQVAQKNK